MSLDFNHITFDHCNRESNQIAHELARLARFSPSISWLEFAPDAVTPWIVNDATL